MASGRVSSRLQCPPAALEDGKILRGRAAGWDIKSFLWLVGKKAQSSSSPSQNVPASVGILSSGHCRIPNKVGKWRLEGQERGSSWLWA